MCNKTYSVVNLISTCVNFVCMYGYRLRFYILMLNIDLLVYLKRFGWRLNYGILWMVYW